MLSYEEALRTIQESIGPLSETESIPLLDAGCRIASRTICATRPNPAFDNSAVDGYLLGSPGCEAGRSFSVVGEIRAGSLPPLPTASAGEAIRIFTGAPVVQSASCVAMQEDVRVEGSQIEVLEPLREGANIRPAGADFESGATLVEQGQRLGPAEVALAAWNGLEIVQVYRKPRVGALVTGDELVPLGSPITEGQIYDSNGPMLEWLARQAVPVEVVQMRLSDDFDLTVQSLSRRSSECDLLVISGGASVGDHDHVPAAVAKIGQVLFHKVSIKPGKPVLFGKIGACFVFGLPGNPASAFVCFELFVREGLRRLAGEQLPDRLWMPAKYAGEHGGGPRDEFERVRLEERDGELWAIPRFEQGSFGLRSLSHAHALARLIRGRSYRPGDPVQVTALPGAL